MKREDLNQQIRDVKGAILAQYKHKKEIGMCNTALRKIGGELMELNCADYSDEEVQEALKALEVVHNLLNKELSTTDAVIDGYRKLQGEKAAELKTFKNGFGTNHN